MINWGKSVSVVPQVIALALTCAACGSDSSGSPAPPAPTASFESGACPTSVAWLPALANARCGYLLVPENRDIVNGPTIRLPVAIIPSVSQPAASDPSSTWLAALGSTHLPRRPLSWPPN